MLGYIRPYKAELRLVEWQRYQAVYCGICKSLQMQFGPVERLAVSYDATFLALFFLAFFESEDEPGRAVCLTHPLRKRVFAAPSPVLDFAASVSAWLTMARGRDDWRDGQRLRAIPELLFFHRAAGIFERRRPQLATELREQFAALAEFEKAEGEAPKPACAEAFKEEAAAAAEFNGRALAAIFREGARECSVPALAEERAARTMELAAYHLGRWVYLIDAVEDRAKDLKKKRYNPFLSLTEQDALRVAGELMIQCEEEVDRHAALLPYLKDGALIGNILCLGLAWERERVFRGEKQKPI